MKTVIFLTDIHYPYHHKRTLDICYKYCKDVKPDVIIYGGDNWDANGISKFTAKDTDAGLIDTYQEMIGFKTEIFDKFSKVCKESVLLLGNHDGQRLTDYLNRHLERGNNSVYNFWNQKFNFKDVFDCEVIPYNEIYTIEPLTFLHGERHNKYHTNGHLDILMRNVMYGHLHTEQVFTKVTKGNEPFQAISVPCASELNPEYMKGRASAWLNGFGVIRFHKGMYFPQVVKVIKGTTIIDGKVY